MLTGAFQSELNTLWSVDLSAAYLNGNVDRRDFEGSAGILILLSIPRSLSYT